MINKYLLSSLVCILFYTAQAHPSSKLPQYNIINDLSSLIKNIGNKDIQDDILSLTGQWGVKLDPDSIGEKHNYFNSGHTTMPIQLPGTLDEAGYGTRTVGSDYGILTRRHKYIGPAWYTREFVIPHNWQGKEITLYLERVLWESKVWIDGRFIDTQEGLGTPHYHRLGTLNPGKHRIAIRINNDMIYNIGDKGHSYGEYTQIIWNGILGKIELQSSPTLSIDRIKVYPHTSDNRLDISFDIQNHSNKTLKGEVSYTLKEIGSKKKIYAYKKENTCPVQKFIDNLNGKIKAKFMFQLSYIMDERNGFVEPYVKHFSMERYRQMYEIRVKAAERMMRIIFYEKNGEIILLHAFYKHDRKDTEKALETAHKILENITDKNGNVKEEYRKELVLCD